MSTEYRGFDEHQDYLLDLIWCVTGVDPLSPWARNRNLLRRLLSLYGYFQLRHWDIEKLAKSLQEMREEGWGSREDVKERARGLPGPVPTAFFEMLHDEVTRGREGT